MRKIYSRRCFTPKIKRKNNSKNMAYINTGEEKYLCEALETVPLSSFNKIPYESKVTMSEEIVDEPCETEIVVDDEVIETIETRWK